MEDPSEPVGRKLILRCGLSPGDIVLLSAAVRDLHRCYPGKFITDVRTSCDEIWDNNPYIQKLSEDDRDVTELDCSYPLINESNEAPYHCLHGFISFLNHKLALAIRPTLFHGDIHLSEQEKAWYSQVMEVTRTDIPFWIIAAGGKFDLTIKWWQTERYQDVVDRLRGKIQFVQVGATGDHHPRLDGVIDLRGQTSLRELIRLVYHAQGVLCSVTSLMHLAAAVETKGGTPPIRPCVVIAGGREPAHWAQYTGHQFIHTIGQLACCATGGCWRDRISPLRDGDERDRRYNLCADAPNRLPRCMHMISVDEVVRRIEGYFENGLVPYLTQAEFKAATRGVRATRENPYDSQPLSLSSAGLACDAAVKSIPNEPPASTGRGIVICGGGVRYFTNAWVCVNMLRRHGCRLPIEVWHLGRNEMNNNMAGLLKPLGVRVVDGLRVRKKHPARILAGWELKPYSILYSTFREVLFLDADNVPTVNPEFLFDTAEFKRSGAIFWPDFEHITGKKPSAIWKSCGLRRPRELEFETGQIVVDKMRCWKALRLCLWFNEHSDFYYQYLHGDKETFHLAFRKVGKSYSLIKKPIHPLDFTMCQHDFEGRRIFQHRNLDKWDLLGNCRIKGFHLEAECEGYVTQLRRLWDGQVRPCKTLTNTCINIKRIPKFVLSILPHADRDAYLRTIRNLKTTDWEAEPIEFACTSANDSDAMQLMLGRILETFPDYVLLLWGDLIFNRHLRHNLSNWIPARHRDFTVGSLYNPQIQEMACDVATRTRLVDPKRGFTPEAVLLSARAIKYLMDRLQGTKRELHGCLLGVARRFRTPVFFHAPSLVQRQRPRSDAPANFHVAMDFDSQWKA